MDAAEFKAFAKSMITYAGDYLENVRDRRVLPEVQPGYLLPLIQDNAPKKPEKWCEVMSDIERVVMPGITHWESPKFHAYYPIENSYPAIVADMLSGAIGCLGFTWIDSPACAELEVIVLDWLVKMLGLPSEFLAGSGGKGGGVINGTASEAVFLALLGAKFKAIQKTKKKHPQWDDKTIISKLVAYSSSQVHSSVDKAAVLGGVKLKPIPADGNNSVRGVSLEEAIRKDIEAGLIPFFAVVSFGTTSSCAFDRLDECGPVGNKHNVWIHVDAAYAGTALVCPEYRPLMKGIQYADSFNFNPQKWMLTNYDCSVMWAKDPAWLRNALHANVQLKHDMQGSVTEYRHWDLALSSRFRALKLWFVLRLYGVENIQAHIRLHCECAKYFERLCLSDARFEIFGKVLLGLVCFRLKGSNEINEMLLKRINTRGNVYMTPSKIRETYFLRMSVCSRYTRLEDMEYTWKEVSAAADDVLSNK